MKIRQVEAELFQAHGCDEANSRFSQIFRTRLKTRDAQFSSYAPPCTTKEWKARFRFLAVRFFFKPQRDDRL